MRNADIKARRQQNATNVSRCLIILSSVVGARAASRRTMVIGALGCREA